jgi:hypothetical protein
MPRPVCVERLECRTLLSLAASAFTENVLKTGSSTFSLAPYVQESDPAATLTYSLVAPTTTAGGTIGVNAATGIVTYTPPASPSSSDSFQYSVSDSDSNMSATETVTLTLASVAANPVTVSEVEGQSTISLTILNLPGAVSDSASKPTYTFSSPLVTSGGGTVSFTNTKLGAFTYTPTGSTFVGDVIISYQVSDGTSTSTSTVELDIGPIAADPVSWGTLSSTTATVPSTIVPSLVNRIHDVTANASFTFSNPVLPAGDGSVTDLSATTGSFTYTAPSASFTGSVTVQYTVSDGTNSTTGSVLVVVAPLITEPVTVTELDKQSTVSLTILNLTGAVQDIATSPTYTFSNLRVIDGGGSIPSKAFDDATTGSFIYALPANATPRPVHIGFTVSDGTNSANGVVTIQLVGIVANAANFSVLQNAPSTLPALAGRIVDVATTPTFTFSAPTLPAGDGAISFKDATTGVLSYTPPSPTFAGTFPVAYKVSDGTNSTAGVLNLTVGPLITNPLLIPGALQTGPTDIPSLVTSMYVQDVAASPVYTFSNPVVPPGDGTIELTDATAGTFTYTPPSATFFGLVQVTYTVTDGAMNSTSGDILINVEQTIRPKNDGPITVVVGVPNTIPASELLGNDTTAPNGLTPSIHSVGSATNGTVALQAGGSVTFTPTATGPASFTYTDTDADSDASTTATVTLDVKLGVTIHWASPAPIVYGTPLTSAQLDAMASVPGTFQYGPSAQTILNAGPDQTLVATFTPTDSVDYADATATVPITVLQATTIVNWPSPANIVAGTPLGAGQLDARASAPGTFAYFPAAGTVLAPGNGQTIYAVFTPFNTADYSIVEATTTINVLPAPPPGLTVQTRSFSGRVKRPVGGPIAQLHTTTANLKPSYYSVVINWEDGNVQNGRLVKAGKRGFTLNATHKFRAAGVYHALVTISDPQGDSVTDPFTVSVH